MPNEHGSGSLLGTVHVFVTTVLAIGAGWSGFQLNQADNRLRDVEASVKYAESERADRESLEKKQMAVYDAVVRSLGERNAQQQRVAKALVTSMLDLDSPLRSELLAVLAETGTPEVQAEVRKTVSTEKQFLQEQSQLSASEAGKTPTGGHSTNYDIFWCELSGEGARRIAEQIKENLEENKAQGRIRVRLLPASVNARPGYQHSGYVIRYNTGEENEAAELSRVGNKVLSEIGSFRQSISYQNTPSYLSAFVCP
ncbi:hypothetical protein YTPLAS18_17910 [Nitrospira sp.]|nr:hypothetical protein YTPLAS18_17910 [Nitrospira sp.]